MLRSFVRTAVVFYLFLSLFALLYAGLFGHLPRIFGEHGPQSGSLLLAAGCALAVVAACHLADRLVPAMRRAGEAFARLVGAVTLPQALLLASVSGFGEELLFRGALWPHLGLWGSSILFGVVHILPVRALRFYPVVATLAGLGFGWLRRESGSVAPPMLAHFLVNALNLAWLGARMRRAEAAAASAPPARLPPDPAPFPPIPETDAESFPRTVWRYHLRLELAGTDRETLPQCLQSEELGLFRSMRREEVERRLREGELVWSGVFREPQTSFPHDLAALSVYVFDVVIGVEVAERYVSDETTDDVRAWKVVARRGEFVKVPLSVEDRGDGTFGVDPEREDSEVLAAQWARYPRWFQDGMRFKYPRLRAL
ncbi:MAG: lysostaphin resistance A-like protein [Planctomycetaceae bacterium]